MKAAKVWATVNTQVPYKNRTGEEWIKLLSFECKVVSWFVVVPERPESIVPEGQ